MDTKKRMEGLRKRQAQIAAQLADLDARERVSRRKAETRRKILLGVAVLKLAENNSDFARWLDMQMPGLLDERDRRQVGVLAQPRPTS